jgi:hypothetical protein
MDLSRKQAEADGDIAAQYQSYMDAQYQEWAEQEHAASMAEAEQSKEADDPLFEEARSLIGDALSNMRAAIISEPSIAESLTPVMERLDAFWLKTSRS